MKVYGYEYIAPKLYGHAMYPDAADLTALGRTNRSATKRQAARRIWAKAERQATRATIRGAVNELAS